MAEKAASPYAGLDKALLRSTRPHAPEPQAVPQEPERPTAPLSSPAGEASVAESGRRRTRKTASETATQQASISASTLADEAELIAAIRGVVKVPGREVSFTRLTAEEEGQLADIVYIYKRRGQKKSENELNRIAFNYLLVD